MLKSPINEFTASSPPSPTSLASDTLVPVKPDVLVVVFAVLIVLLNPVTAFINAVGSAFGFCRTFKAFTAEAATLASLLPVKSPKAFSAAAPLLEVNALVKFAS